MSRGQAETRVREQTGVEGTGSVALYGRVTMSISENQAPNDAVGYQRAGDGTPTNDMPASIVMFEHQHIRPAGPGVAKSDQGRYTPAPRRMATMLAAVVEDKPSGAMIGWTCDTAPASS
jgi:hypothetical protein